MQQQHKELAMNETVCNKHLKRIAIPKDIEPDDVLVLRDGQKRKWQSWHYSGDSVCEGILPGGHKPNGSYWGGDWDVARPDWDVVAIERKVRVSL